MSDTINQAEVNSALNTAIAISPVLLASAGSTVSPQAAGIIKLAPIAVTLLQSASQLQAAGAMSEEQLAALFVTVGQGIASTHAQWMALNAQSSVAS